MHCAGCGNELQEGVIICRFCARIVQFKTHFSPADTDVSSFSYLPIQRSNSILNSDLFKLGIYFLVLCCFVLLANLGLASLEKQNVVHNQWSARVSISRVSIDTLTHDDSVVISGVVTNITDRNLQAVVIRAYVLNTLSRPIGEVYYTVEPEILQPGSVSEISISVPCNNDLVHQVKIEVFDAPEQPEIKRPVKMSRLWVTGG